MLYSPQTHYWASLPRTIIFRWQLALIVFVLVFNLVMCWKSLFSDLDINMLFTLRRPQQWRPPVTPLLSTSAFESQIYMMLNITEILRPFLLLHSCLICVTGFILDCVQVQVKVDKPFRRFVSFTRKLLWSWIFYSINIANHLSSEILTSMWTVFTIISIKTSQPFWVKKIPLVIEFSKYKYYIQKS